MVYERVGISPVKVQERVGKSAFSVCKKAQRIKDAFYVCAKARLCDLFIFQKQCIYSSKEGCKISTTCRYVKGVHETFFCIRWKLGEKIRVSDGTMRLRDAVLV